MSWYWITELRSHTVLSQNSQLHFRKPALCEQDSGKFVVYHASRHTVLERSSALRCKNACLWCVSCFQTWQMNSKDLARLDSCHFKIDKTFSFLWTSTSLILFWSLSLWLLVRQHSYIFKMLLCERDISRVTPVSKCSCQYQKLKVWIDNLKTISFNFQVPPHASFDLGSFWHNLFFCLLLLSMSQSLFKDILALMLCFPLSLCFLHC